MIKLLGQLGEQEQEKEICVIADESMICIDEIYYDNEEECYYV